MVTICLKCQFDVHDNILTRLGVLDSSCGELALASEKVEKSYTIYLDIQYIWITKQISIRTVQSH